MGARASVGSTCRRDYFVSTRASWVRWASSVRPPGPPLATAPVDTRGILLFLFHRRGASPRLDASPRRRRARLASRRPRRWGVGAVRWCPPGLTIPISRVAPRRTRRSRRSAPGDPGLRSSAWPPRRPGAGRFLRLSIALRIPRSGSSPRGNRWTRATLRRWRRPGALDSRTRTPRSRHGGYRCYGTKVESRGWGPGWRG
mmetsp:Transcript_6710/g.30290  ORF Transcript_6710/g.30290 Transcript_6710/m.30290 type:complete len:200 (+) Transcript_6710:827-1426(+)